ncbi:MAG: deoxyribodipyrimidine photo-lyase, partial [Anaerolineae bacterium]|nr:deoxyribodipyrimidine photo-lyase [Anaerolineae bacterium]
MTAVIWWIRRDLRLHDNPALQAALDTGLPLLPLFILDPHLLTGRAEPRENFLLAGLAELDADLRRRGSRLVVRRGSPVQELARLCAEVQAQAVFALEDYSPYSRQRDEAVSQVAPLNLFTGVTVQHPAIVRKADGGPYTVFTPFSKAWKQLPMPKASVNIPDPLPPVLAVVSAPLPAPSTDPLFPPGEREALYRLESFLHGPVEQYADDRNRMDLEGTSALSPYFRFGMLSPRLAANRAMAVSQAAKTAELKR